MWVCHISCNPLGLFTTSRNMQEWMEEETEEEMVQVCQWYAMAGVGKYFVNGGSTKHAK